MIWANRSLHLITIGNAIYCNAFFYSVDQNKRGRLVTYLFRWQYTVKILILLYIPRRRLESVITKYRIHTGAVTDRLTHILLKTLDSSTLEPCQLTTHGNEDNSASNCNSRFSNRDGDKEAKLTDCSFKVSFCTGTYFKVLRLKVHWTDVRH